MDRIILEVNDMAARKWRYLSQEKRNELSNAFNQIISKVNESNDDRFTAILDKIGHEAEANGLTEDILNKLLREE